jgi:hypothetical protein
MRWEIDLAEIYRAASLMWLGRLRELDQLVSRLLTEAVQSGDQYLTTGLRSWRTNLLWLVKNRPAESRRHVVEAQQLTRRDFQGFGMHDTMYLNALCNADLYEGDAAGAWARIEAVWPALRRSHLLSMQSVHTDMAYLRARMAIAFAAVAPPSRLHSLLRAARRASSSLGGSTTRRALGALGKVMFASLGDAVDRVALTGALALADEAGLALHAASARLRFGERLGDAEMVAQARAYMTRERVVNSDALSRVIVPV